MLRVGIAGYGVAARQIIPWVERSPHAELAAVADIRPEARSQFCERYGGRSFESVEAMCASDAVDAVWIGTPNPLHAEHTITAARHGKHVICEKPMAVSMDECERMIDAVEKSGVVYVQGHSKMHDPPIRKMREIVTSGRLGRLIQINTWMYKGWMLRPRLATEVDSALGGGVVFRQGPHQMDIIRGIGGGLLRSVRAQVGRWDPRFHTEGNYSAFFDFEDGTAGSAVYNGYGYFEITELTWGVNEGGVQFEGSDRRWGGGRDRGPLAPDEKYAMAQYARGPPEQRPSERFQPFFGLTIASCERGDIRQSPHGLFVYSDAGREEVSCEPKGAEIGEVEALYRAVELGERPFPDARWGMANLEVCLAILQSARERREIQLCHQVPCPL